MKVILFIIQKEFIQIYRNKVMMVILLVMPIVQLLILSYAADFEIKNIKIHVADQDRSGTSRKLISQIQASDYFVLKSMSTDVNTGFDKIEEDHVDILLTIPNGFEKNIYKNEKSQVQLLTNAINGTKATLANSYLNSMIMNFSSSLDTYPNVGYLNNSLPINIIYHQWYNPTMDYKKYMAPGILVMLVTMLAMFLSSINIVREKEMGTIEQLNVTTLKKSHFIIGKLAPFWIIIMFDFIFGLILITVLFNVPMEGSVIMILLFVNIYLLTMLGMGMLISTISNTQQQAMFISWFFMVIFILLSGLFTPIEFMPHWAKIITRFNPAAYFVQFMRMVMLKGSEFKHVTDLFVSITLFAIVINALAVYNYKKTTS